MNTAREHDWQELDRLIDGLCDQTLSADDATKLSQWLADDPQACDRYVDFIVTYGHMAWQFMPGKPFSSEELHRSAAVESHFGEEEWNADDGHECVLRADALDFDRDFLTPPIVPSLPSSSLPTWHGTAAALQGWPVAYLIATFVVGIGLTLAAVTHRTPPDSIAHTTPTSPSTDTNAPPAPKATVVGRITNIADCRWALQDGPHSIIGGQNITGRPSSLVGRDVTLGDRFSLQSGLMEIRYACGAKVILQGPVNYEVDSADGGYLSIGRVTAKLGERGEGRGERQRKVASGQWPVAGIVESGERKEERGEESSHQPLVPSPSPNPQSLIPNPSSTSGHFASPSLSTLHSPLFTIRTPTAIVTDLGTEFGIEVDKNGCTTSHVFQGVVEVRPVGHGKEMGEIIRLHRDESVRVERGPGESRKLVRGALATSPFVREGELLRRHQEQSQQPMRRWQAYSQQLRRDPALVAYYTFERTADSPWTLPNLSAVGKSLDAQIEVAEWCDGRFAGKHALQFHGVGSFVRLPRLEKDPFNFAGPFSVAVWFRIDRANNDWQALVGKGDDAWRIQKGKESGCLTFDHNNATDSHVVLGKTNVCDRHWHLGVIVFEPANGIGHKRLYVDGHLDAEGAMRGDLQHNDEPVLFGGNSMKPERGLFGTIDEIAVLSRAMSAGEVAAMFAAGTPAASPNAAHPSEAK